MPLRQQPQAGFTLIELMLVTTLLGVIASIALPNLMAFRVRSGRAEVRTHMAALAQAEFSYYGETNLFTDDLTKIDWSLQGSPRYLYGFTSDASGSGNNDTGELRANGHATFDTHRMVDGFGILLTDAELPPAVVAGDTFRIGAAGNLDIDPTLDRWTFDRDGTLTNVTDELSL